MKNENNICNKTRNIIEYCKKTKSLVDEQLNTPYKDTYFCKRACFIEFELQLLLTNIILELSNELLRVINQRKEFIFRFNYNGIFDNEIDEYCGITQDAEQLIIVVRKSRNELIETCNTHYEFKPSLFDTDDDCSRESNMETINTNNEIFEICYKILEATLSDIERINKRIANKDGVYTLKKER